MNAMALYIIASVIIVWLLGLTLLLLKTRLHYLKLTTRTKKDTIEEILDTLVENERSIGKDLTETRKEVEKLIEESSLYFKKIGVVRFDPYGKKGDTSFVVALLNKVNTGLVINFIYTHEGVRVYPKKVKAGGGEEHALSEEEKKAIEKAM